MWCRWSENHKIKIIKGEVAKKSWHAFLRGYRNVARLERCSMPQHREKQKKFSLYALLRSLTTKKYSPFAAAFVFPFCAQGLPVLAEHIPRCHMEQLSRLSLLIFRLLLPSRPSKTINARRWANFLQENGRLLISFLKFFRFVDASHPNKDAMAPWPMPLSFNCTYKPFHRTRGKHKQGGR